MESIRTKEIYGEEWFKKRAISSITRIDNTSWDYSDSILLYLPGHDETYEYVQGSENQYNEIVTSPEQKYLDGVASKITEILPIDFDYVDLGPGTEHKEQYIFDELKKQGKHFNYHPVDISERYLEYSSNHAEVQGIKTSPIRSSFEDLPDKLSTTGRNRFVSLGLTYSNYNPSKILSLLKNIRGEKGNIFVNSQIRDRINIDKLRSAYEEIVVDILVPKLKLLGLNIETDLSDIEITDEIKVWYSIKNLNEELEQKGVRLGDRILVVQSLRPTLNSLNDDISKEFDDYELLDTGESFVGVITR